MTVVSEVTERVNAKYGKVYADNAEMGQKAFDDNTTFLKQELLKDYNQFMYNKRHVISDLYTSEINSFKERNNINDDSVLYEGIYTGSIIMYANDSEIKELAKDSSVIEISIWEDDLTEDNEETYHDIINTDSNTGTKSSNYNTGSGYKGTGVIIGIIEAEGGKYQPAAKQLQGIHGTRLEYIGIFKSTANDTTEETESEHATKVTSILVGQSYELNQTKYEGIVPNATAYQASKGDGTVSLVAAAQALASIDGLSVINYSAGRIYNYENLEYTDVDKEIDEFCISTGVTFITSAGNNNAGHPFDDVTGPGKGYNVITVGNANTTTNIGTDTSPLYNIRPSSCYKEASYLTNKPDLVAPGTEISCVGVNNKILTGSGTSYSAPMVTGVVAQLHQVDPSLISNPTKTKAIILAGADPTLISTVENNSVGSNGLVREKSGVGMLNAVNSINIALNYQSSFAQLFFMEPPAATNYNMGFVNVEKGHTLRVVLTFNKAEDNLLIQSAYGNNFDLYVVDSKGNVVSSCSTINNVEVVEVVAPEDTMYTIQVRIAGYNLAANLAYIYPAVAWRTMHNYTDHYVQRASYPAHYAYCACGDYIEENHTFISGPVGTYCSKCYYISSYN